MENVSHTDSFAYEKLSFDRFRDEVLKDYRLICESRQASLLGRREVLTGKAKFGIFGDGKEVAQVAVAKFFQPGDFLSGYYRDQTLAFASGQATMEEFFSQLYADPDSANEPHSSGRQMNSHFATAMVDENGEWLDIANRKNIAAGMAPTAAQMPRSLGLALASKLFRHSPALQAFTDLSNNGNEVCFCTIGDASTSEGHFWETINAAGVLQVPLAIFVWDDGYGISVPKEYQTIKGSISEALKGMQIKEETNGIEIYKLKAWDYAGMCEVFETAIQKIRDTHVPATPSCGCTTPVFPQAPIAAGKIDKITAGFNAAAAGPFNKTITVKLAGIDAPLEIRITGEVLTSDDYAKFEKEKSSKTAKTGGKK